MTTDAMNCDRFNDRLMDYLEQDTDAATRTALERHAVTCDDCGALLADIRKLRMDAANLPELAPSQDLWAGIAQRIETPVLPIGAAAADGQNRGGAARVRPRWLKAGLVAASLIAAAALGYGVRGEESRVVPAPSVGDRPPIAVRPESIAATGTVADLSAPVPGEQSMPVVPAPAPAAGGAPPPASAGTRPVEVQLAVATLTADYDREIARLRVLIEQRRSQLDPSTVQVIERNLAVIDTAIAESRRAIANDPASRFLIEFLNQSLQAKVELMRTAALLPSRT